MTEGAGTGAAAFCGTGAALEEEAKAAAVLREEAAAARRWDWVIGESVLLVKSTTRPGVLPFSGERRQDLLGDVARCRG